MGRQATCFPCWKMEMGTLPSLQWVERHLSQQALPKPLRKRKEVSNVPTEAAAVVGEEEEEEEEESTREGPALVEATGLDTRIRKAAVEEETGAPQVKVVKGMRLLRMLTATRL